MKIDASKIKKIYLEGQNINSFLKNELNVTYNTAEIIELSYDLQAGSYTDSISNSEYFQKYYSDYTKELSCIIKSLCPSGSILEAGVGEATTLANLLNYLDGKFESYGFDISFSRILYAKKYLNNKNHMTTKLCTGNLFDIPFQDSSIDLVYTSHSIEPNGGNEKKILQELYRVTNKYLILLEPAYEFSNDKTKKYMDKHGYCKNLKTYALELGFNVIRHELFKYSANINNPTAILIIEKNTSNGSFIKDKFACPINKTKLINYNNNQALYSEESLLMYPIIDEIPCLIDKNAILATKLLDEK